MPRQHRRMGEGGGGIIEVDQIWALALQILLIDETPIASLPCNFSFCSLLNDQSSSRSEQDMFDANDRV